MRVAQLFYTFVALLSTAVDTVSANCNADNCLRQVRASAFPTRPTTRDCSAFQITTVGIVPSPSVPAYASNCNSARYSSACSCIGIVATTVPQPVYAIEVLFNREVTGKYYLIPQRTFDPQNTLSTSYFIASTDAAAAQGFYYDAPSGYLTTTDRNQPVLYDNFAYPGIRSFVVAQESGLRLSCPLSSDGSKILQCIGTGGVPLYAQICSGANNNLAVSSDPAQSNILCLGFEDVQLKLIPYPIVA